MENWKDIKGFEGVYKISDHGRVESVRSNIILKPRKDRGGYSLVNLWSNNVGTNFKIHRLVAEAFLENPLLKPHINHLNAVRSDNRLENLEWCTRSENMKHCVLMGNNATPGKGKVNELNPKSKPISQYSLAGVLVKKYPSARQAERETGISAKCISRVAKGQRPHTSHFNWIFQ